MKVKDLKRALDNLDDDLRVMLQTDPEGNGYYEVSGIDADAYTEDPDEYSPEISSAECLKENLEDEGIYDEDPTEGYTQVALIYP